MANDFNWKQAEQSATEISLSVAEARKLVDLLPDEFEDLMVAFDGAQGDGYLEPQYILIQVSV